MTAKYEPQHLTRWSLPAFYTGQSWHGYYSAPVGRSRDSDALELSNWEAQLQAVGGERGDTVVVVRERHFLVGWVEWLAIRETATATLRKADAVAARLLEYPILDEHLHEAKMVELGEVDLEDDAQ